MPKTSKHQGRNSLGPSVGIVDVLGSGVSKIKKKIRDIERLLKKENLAADVRVENERALKALKVELKNSEVEMKSKKTAKRYHMVRFFERKKAIRRLKNAKRALKQAMESKDEKEEKKAKTIVYQNEVDLIYVILYPKSEKYISLYPTSDAHESEDALHNEKLASGLQITDVKRQEFLKLAEKILQEGRVPFSIDEVLKGKRARIDDQKQNFILKEEIDAPSKQRDENEDTFLEETSR